MLHVVGLDLSLSGTGIARVRPETGEPAEVTLIQSKPNTNARSYMQTLDRLRQIAARVLREARKGRQEGDLMVVAIEGPAHEVDPSQRGTHARIGLFWILVHLLEKEALILIVPPSSLKRYVTGKGNAAKDLVLTTIVRAHPGVGVIDNNEADALGLAAMVCRYVGHPIEISAQRVGDGAALGGVDWPEQIRHL